MLTNRKYFVNALVISLCLFIKSNGYANPISADFINDSRCDFISNQPLSHQLGLAPAFPIDERVSLLSITPNASPICVSLDPNLSDNFEVTIKNDSPTAWKDLFLVAANGITFGNADGTVREPLDIGPFRDAFRIDALGLNANLISESLTANGIFEPNESWTFVVNDYSAGTITPQLFSTLGLNDGSPAYLLANPVPIPAAIWLFLSGLFGLFTLRRKKDAIDNYRIIFHN